MADFSEFTSDNNIGIITKADNNIGTDNRKHSFMAQYL